ncbi:MAG: ATP-binding protein, partial [Tomitella sp.]|nr:ATP-binding protein [Tomitella sp.]
MSGDREKLHSAVLVAPAKERRRLRKQRLAAAAELVAEQRQKEQAQAREKKAAERAERRATRYLPAAGEPGPATLRTPGRFRLPRHQDTSAMLSGAYPFLAEGGLGSQGVFIGQDLYS